MLVDDEELSEDAVLYDANPSNAKALINTSLFFVNDLLLFDLILSDIFKNKLKSSIKILKMCLMIVGWPQRNVFGFNHSNITEL